MKNINIYSNIENINEYLKSLDIKVREIPKKLRNMKKIELFILDYEKIDRSLINEILSYEENKYILFNTKTNIKQSGNIINTQKENVISLLDTIIHIKNKDYLENFLKQLATGIKYYCEIDIDETNYKSIIEKYENITKSNILSNKKYSLMIIENSKNPKKICEITLKCFTKNAYPYVDIIDIDKKNSFYVNGNINKLQMIIVEGSNEFNYKICVNNDYLYKKLINKFSFGIDFVKESKADILINQLHNSNFSYKDMKNDFEITMNENNLIEFIEFLNDYNRGDIEILFPSIDTIYSDIKNVKELTYVEKIMFDYSDDTYPIHFRRSDEILDNYEYKYGIKFYYDDDKRAYFDATLEEEIELNNVRNIAVQREGIYKEYEPMYKIFLFN